MLITAQQQLIHELRSRPAGAPPLFICTILLVLQYSAHQYSSIFMGATAAASGSSSSSSSSSFLPLTEGLNVSVADLLVRAPRVAGYGSGVFLPLLSSPGFNSSHPQQSTGFSFGFFSTSNPDFSNISLAVCGGLSGKYSEALNSSAQLNIGASTYVDQIIIGGAGVEPAPNSYAMPVWTANTANVPLKSNTSSLLVSRVAPDRNELQLRDENGVVVWSVNGVGLMEMQDSGNLVIYDTVDKHQMVWQSLTQPRDILVQNQELSAGMELTSKDFSYLARMENGGLVFYVNCTDPFNERPSPYAVVPVVPLNNSESGLVDLKKHVLASPCDPHKLAYTVLDQSSWYFSLDLGCTSDNVTNSLSLPEELSDASYTWSFLQLGIDGRLHIYAVDTTNPSAVNNTMLPIQQYLAQENFFDWGECDVPLACGPLGVCTPFVTSYCACPHPSQAEGINLFNFIDSTDVLKGCTPVTPLPVCKRSDEHISYLQLNETSNLFLLSGWPFASTLTTRVDKCKKLCSSNCSCIGFVYKNADTTYSSSCFFITDPGISFLGAANSQNATITGALRSYATYLKINPSSDLASPNNGEYKSTIPATSAPSASNRKHESTIAAITIVLSTFVACSLALGLFVYLFLARRQRKARDRARQAEEKQLQDILPFLPCRFSYPDLHKATEGFSKILGAGGCGSVYAGVLPDGRKIAVKVLGSGILRGHQSKQFLAEVATVGRTSHHNIVCLVGFCWEVSHRLLVYEYMERGSLDCWLFAKGVDEETTLLLDWQTRYNVALGIARGLTYLHEECPQPILHFDIKPQNILLDHDYVAKLADFGLSKLMQRGVSEVVTVVRGTPGYIAPEWTSHGAVTKKSDIYSMGMVMLEIVGGRKNVDFTLLSSVGNEWHFPSWAAKKCEKGFMLELVDKRIAQAYNKEQAFILIQTAFWCIHENASMRPDAPTVLQWLEGSSPMKPPPFSAIAHAQFSIAEVSS